MNEQITLNGIEVWAFLKEIDGGYRVRLALDDWDRCNIGRGERVPVRRWRKPVEWLFLAEAVEMPPVAWFNLEVRVEMAV